MTSRNQGTFSREEEIGPWERGWRCACPCQNSKLNSLSTSNCFQNHSFPADTMMNNNFLVPSILQRVLQSEKEALAQVMPALMALCDSTKHSNLPLPTPKWINLYWSLDYHPAGSHPGGSTWKVTHTNFMPSKLKFSDGKKRLPWSQTLASCTLILTSSTLTYLYNPTKPLKTQSTDRAVSNAPCNFILEITGYNTAPCKHIPPAMYK